ncbi:hypothetical protein CLOBOL_05884 [Enterocloster bolteae ATCC BAA-613]|uniref:Uncharacterized protein n=1 Tax=Enterocloster bolteae (strain ATCC BAA-613 / DSM 15670 / CCUG 46953 / JCM 12243 / WAL 16351) TaxID=411902 RepID=A8S185_ENTBW|nr:hypothetical protein CLOBOL_05884 [Enterocloster bolteae ATCC BAA-613]
MINEYGRQEGLLPLNLFLIPERYNMIRILFGQVTFRQERQRKNGIK